MYQAKYNIETGVFYFLTEHIGRLLYEITILLIALVGISCNLLAIAFMLYSKVKHSFHFFLASLKANDLLYLIFALLHCISAFLPYFDLG